MNTHQNAAHTHAHVERKHRRTQTQVVSRLFRTACQIPQNLFRFAIKIPNSICTMTSPNHGLRTTDYGLRTPDSGLRLFVRVWSGVGRRLGETAIGKSWPTCAWVLSFVFSGGLKNTEAPVPIGLYLQPPPRSNPFDWTPEKWDSTKAVATNASGADVERWVPLNAKRLGPFPCPIPILYHSEKSSIPSIRGFWNH